VTATLNGAPVTCQTAEFADRTMTRAAFRTVYSFIRRVDGRFNNPAALAARELAIDPHHCFLVGKCFESRYQNENRDVRTKEGLDRFAWRWQHPQEPTYENRHYIPSPVHA
jgi:hypothetical protein